jgi:fructokinase
MLRIGIDLGGSKIEGIVIDAASQELARERVATPGGDYRATLQTVVDTVQRLQQVVGAQAPLPVGIGTPGAPSRLTGRMKNCNSTCLNDRPLQQDLEALLGRELRLANDADCLALSEASDGAAGTNRVRRDFGYGCGWWHRGAGALAIRAQRHCR